MFTYHIFYLLYLRISIPNIHNNIIDISSFQTELNVLFSSTGFYFKSKVIADSHKGKICFLIFRHFFLKCTFLRLRYFFLGYYLSSQFNSSVPVLIFKIHDFVESFLLLLSEWLWSPKSAVRSCQLQIRMASQRSGFVGSRDK